MATPANYYVSFTGGNDLNNGLSPATPWKTFLNVNAKTFIPGDKIYLKSGDTWNEELNLNGSGSITYPIILSTYSGTLQANIWRTDKALHKSVVMNKPSYWNVSNLDCRTGKIGIYLRFDNFETGKNVTITNCFLKDYDNGEFDAAINNYEYALSAGIWLGGFVPAPASDLSLAYYNVFDSLTVKFCGFENCDVGLGTNFYFPPVYYNRVKNIFFSDSYSLNCLNGIQHFFNTTGGLTTRVRSLYSGGYSPNGTTGGFLQSCNSYTVDNCEFAFTDRNNCADGVGFDFEGDTHDCVFSNNVVHDNDGPAMLVMSTAGTNTNVLIFNNTYYNNAINPYNSLFYEMLGYDGNTNGIVTNSGFYKGPGVTTFSTLWNNFTLAGNRETTPYSSVSSLPYTWEFNTASNLEGWNSFNTWTGNTVSGGNLNGTSGIDAYALSSSVFVNSFEKWKVRVRMRQSAGTTGQLFYITDADPNWNVAKSVTFTITPDGTFYDYIIDLKQSDLKGVITQIRLDPTNSSGSNMAIDYIRVE